MLRLLIDENLDQRILRGLRLRVPVLDVVIVQDTAMRQGVQCYAASTILKCRDCPARARAL